jgi:hypothetical protein
MCQIMARLGIHLDNPRYTVYMTVTTKNLLFVAFLLVIMAGLLAWYLIERPSLQLPTTATSTPAQTQIQPKLDFSAAPLHVIEHGQYYDADLQYPSATPLSNSSNTSANTNAIQTMKAFTQATLATFKKDGQFDTLTPADAQIQGLDQNTKYALSDSYTPYSGSHTISYVFNIYEDTLGAHPNTYFHTFTFDMQSGKSLNLADVFVSGSDYLNQLSTLSRAALTKQQGSNADSSMITNGTTSTTENFQNFVIDGKDFVIIFPPYQVAPYSLGTQTVRIPLADLKSELLPAYQ